MNDFVIGMAVSVMVQLVRNPSIRGKWKAAILKVFREIAINFKDDPAFKAEVIVQSKPFEMR